MLTLSSEQLLEVLNHLPVPVVVLTLDAPSHVVFANVQFGKTFGYTREELPTAEAWFERAYPDPVYRAELAQRWGGAVLQAVHQQGVVESLEVRVTCRDGTVRDVMAGATVSGTRLIASFTDLTERKRAEEQLRISEARHRYLAENARDVLWTMSLEGRITYVSPSIERVRGFTPEEAMKQTIDQIHTPHSAAISLGYFTELYTDLAAGRPPKSFRAELEYRCKDGSTFWTEVMAYPLKGPDGKVVEVLGVTRDLSERKRVEESSRRAALGTLVAGVAHEINNPLATVAASDAFAVEDLKLLRDKLLGGGTLPTPELLQLLAEVLDALETSVQGAERIARVVKDLSLLGKPDAPRGRAKLVEVVARARDWLPVAVPPSVTLRIDPQFAAEVVAYEVELVQVVIELLTNALHAIPEGRRGAVTITIAQGAAGCARLSVRDDGVGMSREVLARAFDPFFTTRSVGKGRGLGLAVANALVASHGGTLTAESELGRGSTFRVELPLAPAS